MKLVPLDVFYEPTQAWIALNRLKAEGIQAVMDNEALVQTSWMWGEAVGQIRILVSESEAEKAKTILDEKSSVSLVELESIALEERPEESRPAALPKYFYPDVDEEDADAIDETRLRDLHEGMQDSADEPEPNRLEQNVDRAYRGAILSLMFPLLSVFVAHVLYQILVSDESMRPEYRGKLIWACVLTGMFLVFVILFLRAFFVLVGLVFWNAY